MQPFSLQEHPFCSEDLALYYSNNSIPQDDGASMPTLHWRTLDWRLPHIDWGCPLPGSLSASHTQHVHSHIINSVVSSYVAKYYPLGLLLLAARNLACSSAAISLSQDSKSRNSHDAFHNSLGRLLPLALMPNCSTTFGNKLGLPNSC